MVCPGDAFFERFPPLMNRGNPAANNAFNRALNHARNQVLNGHRRRAHAVERPHRGFQEMPAVLNLRHVNEALIRGANEALGRGANEAMGRAQNVARNDVRNRLEDGNRLPLVPPGLPELRIEYAPNALVPPRIVPRNDAVFNEAFAVPNRALNQGFYQAYNRMHDQALNMRDHDGVEGFRPVINQPIRPIPDRVRNQGPEQDPIGQRLIPPGRRDLEDLQRLVRSFKDSFEWRRRQAAVQPREEDRARKNNHWNFPRPPDDDDKSS